MERKSFFAYAAVAIVAAAVTAGIAALLVNIFQRKQEARTPYVRVVEITENDLDPAKWGADWPREYDGYQRTAEPTWTKYGGGLVGPEGTLPPEKAQRDPWLTKIFAGYLFAIDYRDRRGHAYMLSDQEVTKRNVPSEAKQSGNCLHCHASIMPLYKKLGDGDIQKGLAAVSEMSYWDAHKALEQASPDGKAHPVGCIDCHNPQTMELRVTRPGFIAAIAKLAASDAPVPHLPSVERWRHGDKAKPYDPNTDGTRQEMRSFVCGQCHVEYYCGKGLTLFYPWNEGLKVEQMEHYYDNLQVKGARFKDWVHAETGMELLKAQHPEFELWSQGIHARSGVACADCHMPYQREGSVKISEHWVRSPLLQVNRSCAVCHPYGDDEIKGRVTAIQDRHYALLNEAGKAASEMIDAIVAVKKQYADPDMAAWRARIAKDPKLQELGELQRAAQWRLDFVAAENSMGFHAPQEMARILGESIDLSRQAEVKAVALAGGKLPPQLPPEPIPAPPGP
ncbi:MAG TPA: ammonia-forming cytochrome c nitrite reductase subunit c552 [Myxococcales bacterium]|nr:ammonia-forming cytochrome c nitrite reductase subunit c552 [Myxococcales bacterium]